MADKPVTREEKYLAYLTGDYKGELPKPITRKDKYLYELCLKGIGGEISPEEIKAAVNEYLEKNPAKPGATAEQAHQIEQNKTDVASLKEEIGSLKEGTNSLKEDLTDKLTKPETAEVGQIFRIKSINDDGSLALEAVDIPSGGGGAVKDVQVNGASIVSDGVASIPIAVKGYGVARVNYVYGITQNENGFLYPHTNNSRISSRAVVGDTPSFVLGSNIDYAVKCAMTDGKGAAWTDTEKTGAWSRLTSIKTVMDDVALAGAKYLLGELTELSVALPDDALTGQEIAISWYNGDTPSTLSVAGNMLDFDYAPEANTRSEINCLWDGTYWSVIGMSQDVPADTTEEVVADE